ncbi:MAG: Fic family protein, partial [Bacteroidales bacterium]|nr:Fic family protein [Bacteroidales bacterium]
SRLSEEQTRYIFETNTIGFAENDASVNVDDIIETVNHFFCFDYMLDIAAEPLSENHIQHIHYLLKINTSDARKDWFRVGKYKLLPNMIGDNETSSPENVQADMEFLLSEYHRKAQIFVEDIIDLHYNFERIHPFQDGNGRVGRLVIFKECLKHNIIPFIIEDTHKFYYYRGLSEYPRVKGFLTDTCLSAQDEYAKMKDFFRN